MFRETSLHCQRCGTPVAADVRFCPACGQRQGVPDPSAAASDDPLLARVRAALLNEYEVAREIGRGGMAAVFLAEDLRLPRRVALKVMLPELAYHEAMPQRFVAEARTAAMLDHPNIVPVFQAGEREGLRYFAMRFIDGCSLEQLQRAQGGLPVDLACHILSEVAAALAYAHAVGVVHRDVKPSNVMLDHAWARAIVTDFGIARIADGQRLTNTGLAIGTPEYMSPEQYSNDHLTGASDQYALGAVAYQLLAGRPPFQGSQAEVLVAHLKEPPPALRTLRPEVPLAVEALISRMLAKEPADRWPSLAELAAHFAEHVGSSPASVRQQLIALIPPRASGDALPRTPASPVPGTMRSESAVVGAVIDAASAPIPTPAAPVPAEPASIASTPGPSHTAPLESVLDAAPGLRATSFTPQAVVPVAPAEAALEAVPSPKRTEVTPRGVIPIRSGVDGRSPALVDELPDDELVDDEFTAEQEARELPDEERTSSAAVDQHRAWLQTDAGAAPPPQPKRSLFIGIGAVAAAAALVVFVINRPSDPKALGATGVVAESSAAAVVPPPKQDSAPGGIGPDSLVDSAVVAAARARADSLLTAARRSLALLVSGRRAPATMPLVQGGALQLSARIEDGFRRPVSGAAAFAWRSSDTTRATVSASGIVRALAGDGSVRITAQSDTLRQTVVVQLKPNRPTVGAESVMVRPSETPAALTAEAAHRMVDSAIGGIGPQSADALQRLFASAPPGAPSPDRLFETLRKEKELHSELVTGEYTPDPEHPSLAVHLRLSWKRGGIGAIKGKRDGKTADVLARLERAGPGWRVASLQLTRPFKP
jgi:serine/threonine protein kinase